MRACEVRALGNGASFTNCFMFGNLLPSRNKAFTLFLKVLLESRLPMM